MRYDSVVIGSGVSGLTAALVLAQNGQKVALVEKNPGLAPLIRRFKRGNFWCDPGFHYSGGLEERGTMSVMLRYLRMRDRIQAVPMNEDAYDVLRMGDREIRFPVGIENTQRVLTDHFPKSKQAVDAYVSKLRYVMESTPFLNFDLHYHEFPADPSVSESLDVFLRQRGAEDQLVNLLGMYGCFLYGSPGSDIPFYLHSLVMGPFFRSPQMLRHGGDEIVNAFSSRLEEEGVRVLCKTAVTGIEVDDNRRIKGVRVSDGDVLECTHCVSTIHPGLLLEIISPDAVRPAFLSRLKRLEDTGPAFAVFLQADCIPPELAGSNYHAFGRSAHRAFSVMACGANNDADNKKAICILSECGKDNHPDPWRSVAWRSERYGEYKARDTENCLNSFLELFPAMKGKCRVADAATPFTYERYTGTPGGSMYGVKQSIRYPQLSPATSVRGLYLAGQSVLIPGIMGSMISAFLAAFFILDGKSVWNEMTKCK